MSSQENSSSRYPPTIPSTRTTDKTPPRTSHQDQPHNRQNLQPPEADDLPFLQSPNDDDDDDTEDEFIWRYPSFTSQSHPTPSPAQNIPNSTNQPPHLTRPPLQAPPPDQVDDNDNDEGSTDLPPLLARHAEPPNTPDPFFPPKALWGHGIPPITRVAHENPAIPPSIHSRQDNQGDEDTESDDEPLKCSTVLDPSEASDSDSSSSDGEVPLRRRTSTSYESASASDTDEDAPTRSRPIRGKARSTRPRGTPNRHNNRNRATHHRNQLPVSPPESHVATINQLTAQMDHTYGDLPTPVEPNHLRIYTQNVMGIRSGGNNDKTEAIGTTMATLGVGVFGLQETNVDWKKKWLRSAYQNALYKASRTKGYASWRHSKTEHSTSALPSPTSEQHGGTSLTVTSKWTGRVCDSGNDETLGRWTWQTLNGKNTKLTIINAYRVCQEIGDKVGELTAVAQQHTLLYKPSNRDPNPRQQILDDLSSFIAHKQSQGHAIILLMDGNDDCLDPRSKLQAMVNRVNLVDLHYLRHGETCPPTYKRGTQKIDFIFGCPMAAHALRNATVLPFEFGFKSDHRGMYVDLDTLDLFESATEQVRNPPTRNLNTINTKNTEKYQALVEKGWKSNRIVPRLEALLRRKSGTWTKHDQLALERVDKQMTKIMLDSEKQATRRSFGYARSNELTKAGQTYRYWTTRLSALRIPSWDASKLLKFLEKSLTNPPLLNLNIDQVVGHIKIARKHLTHCQANAKTLRQEQLEESAKDAAYANDTTAETELNNMLKREAMRNLHKNVKRDLQDDYRSNVYFVEVPTDNLPPRQSKEWGQVREADAMYDEILSYSESHYSMAQKTPFGSGPRAAHSGGTGVGPTAQAILQGKYNHQLSDLHTEAIKFLNSVRTPDVPLIDITITLIQATHCYLKWRESTSTSPSGRHLGHYIALAKTKDLLLPIVHIMNLALKHGISLNRWHKSTMCMIEKDIGRPKLHRLRLIHLFEADLNGIAKMIWGRRSIYHALEHNKINPNQHGGIPGRETQHVLLKFRMTADSATIMRNNLALHNNDAMACYDRILQFINGIVQQSNGMPASAVEMQGNCLLHMEYSAKTAHGTSKQSWENSAADQKAGLGQGNGWSPPNWAGISSKMIEIHEAISECGMTVKHPHGKSSTYRTIDAYVDDANNGANDSHTHHGMDPIDLVYNLQLSSQQWERLLHITGGALELNKCFWSLLSWKWAEGMPVPTKINDIPCDINIDQSETNETVTIKRLESDQPFKLLGVQVQLQGPMTTNFNIIREKARMLARKIKSSSLNTQTANLAYNSVALPQLQYSLLMTTYTEPEINKIQKPLTNAFLSRMGFNRNMRRDVIYGPRKYGGYQMGNLAINRGHDQIKYLIGHIRMQDPLGLMMAAVLAQLQLFSGSGTHILEDPFQNLSYTPDTWFKTVITFLRTIKASIIFKQAWNPPIQREHDTYLMDDFRSHTKSKTQLERLNACRLHLQVYSLADICNETGTHLRSEVFDGSLDPRRSSIQWPRQSPPTLRMWKVWRSMLFKCYLEKRATLELTVPLGKWHPNTITTQWPNVYHRATDVVYTADMATPGSYAVCSRTRHRSAQYANTATYVDESDLPSDTIPCEIRPNMSNTLSIASAQSTPTCDKNREHRTLSSYISALPPELRKLLYHQAPSVSIEEMGRLIKNGEIEVGTDGSVINGAGTFSWVCQVAKETVWEGYGYVSGSPDQTTSYRSEISGLTAVMLFFYIVCKFLNITESTSTIKTHTDNKAAVLRKCGAIFPLRGTGRHLSADYDIESVLRQVLNDAPFKSHAHWVKGHQDDVLPFELLTPEAQLNVLADELAGIAQEDRPDNLSLGSLTDQVYESERIALFIESKKITTHMKSHIVEARQTAGLREYYTEKHAWNATTWDTVDWEGFHSAVRNSSHSKDVFRAKLLSEWLPVGARQKHIDPTHNPACPSCSNPNEAGNEETFRHIFTCSNPRRREQQNAQFNKLTTRLHTMLTHCKIRQAIISNLIAWRNNEDPQRVPITGNESVTDRYIAFAINEQAEIGWLAFQKGLLSKYWRKAQQCSYRTTAHSDPEFNPKYHNGDVWTKRVVTELHDIAHSTWCLRNRDLHGDTPEEQASRKTDNVRKKVRMEYTKIFSYSAKVQWRYFNLHINERVRQSRKQLQAWIINLHYTLDAEKT